MNQQYETLAGVYDNFMEEVPYEKWLDFLQQQLQTHELPPPKKILDLCCGTGTMTLSLANLGYEMTGVDLSEDMLAMAQKKVSDTPQTIDFFQMDMTELYLPKKYDAVICCCDGLNYCCEDGELFDTFSGVANALTENGLFLFDMNTEYKFKEVLGNQEHTNIDETSAYFWANEYDDDEKINTYYVNLFLETENGLYERQEECHYERAYTIEEISENLQKASFEIIDIFSDYEKKAVHETTERFVFIVKKRRI
ncbi:MAG: class I SAM-dependent methyltransferase [Bacillota bacterium]